jgi:hypothetical protein
VERRRQLGRGSGAIQVEQGIERRFDLRPPGCAG